MDLSKSLGFKDDIDYILVNVFCTTWNVNSRFPREDLSTLLQTSEPPDIYCIGFQELDVNVPSFIGLESEIKPECVKMVSQALHPGANYVSVEFKRMAAMMMMVFIRDELYSDVTHVASSNVETGVMGLFGNKGGIGIRFDLFDTSLCFVNSHLSAHTHNFLKRNDDFRKINLKMKFSVGYDTFSLWEHDKIFWMGDLNYRLQNIEGNDAKQIIRQDNYLSLLKFDQLRSQKKINRVFVNYKEGAIEFLPTFKYDPGTDVWDTSEKNRTPAWCDRILWKGSNCDQLFYESLQEVISSDHKPVRSMFSVELEKSDDDEPDSGTLYRTPSLGTPRLCTELGYPIGTSMQLKFEELSEKQICDELLSLNIVTNICFISFPEGVLEACAPGNFSPEDECIKDIINAFQEDIDGLAERGIDVGCGINVSMPDRIDEGVAIFGYDEEKGGASVFLSKNYVLLFICKNQSSLEKANLLGYEIIGHLHKA